MSKELHGSHRWNETGEVAVCRDCSVEGYDDEPAAFAECLVGPPPPPEKKPAKGRTPCPATLDSRDDPGHTHRCVGGHSEGDHLCSDCRRWFGVR